jgi:hypothetical protein
MAGNEKGKPIFLLKDIEDKHEQERYQAMQGAKDNTAAVQLTCASCHVADSGDTKLAAGNTSAAPARSGGAYMVPVNYENNCKACHPLTLGSEKDKPLTVPHHLQPAQVHEFLEQALLLRIAGDKATPLLDEEFVPRRTLPGKPPEPSKVKKEIGAVLAERVAVTENLLFPAKQTCGECHKYSGAVEIKPGEAPKFTIDPPAVPTVWFKHARFDHTAHRAVKCVDCHTKAETSKLASDVLVPGIENCRMCHGPAEVVDGKPKGGVRFGCTECHSYHHGDDPLQGIGSAARGVKDRMTIQEFLSGQGPKR